MKKLITLSFVLILCSNIVITNQDTSGINQSKNISEVESQESVKNFEDLYLQQKDFNESILKTVYWALGSIILVLLGIVGSNIYSNYQFNKKKYDDLLKEHRREFDELKVTLFNKIVDELDIVFKNFVEKYDAFKKEIDERLKQDRKELGDDYKDRLNSFSENLKEQIDTLRKNIGGYVESNEKALNEINKKLIQIGVATKESINNEIKTLKIDIYEVEADVWISKKVYNNALFDYLRQARLCIELERNWKLEYSLKNILEMILKCDYFAEVNELGIDQLLPLIPEEFSELKVEISEATKKLKLKEKENRNN